MNTYKSKQQLINELVDVIDKLRVGKNYSIYELASRSCVSINTIKHIYKKKSFPGFKTIYNICNSFDIPIWFFFYQIEDIPSLTDDSIFLVENYKKLSDKSKRLLTELSENLK